MIGFKHKGNFNNINKFLKRMKEEDYNDLLELYAIRGVEMLRQATPRDTGLTAESWDYEIVEENGNKIINWINTNISDGFSVALLIQYGHGTPSGVFVQGHDYINPALKDAIDRLAEDIWEEVKRA
jgi:hypothetical protein